MSKRKMKDSGVEWLGEIPSEWGVMRLRFLVDITTGNRDTQDADPEGEYPFYVRSPIVQRCNGYTFEGPGIMMAGDGAGAGRIFHLATGRYAVHQRVYRLYDFKGIDKTFLWYYLGVSFPNEMDKGSAQSTVPSVRLPMLQNLPAVVPALPVQLKIAAYLDVRCAKIDEMISDAKKTIEEYKAWKSSVIFEAVTGKNTGAKMKDSGVDWIGMVPSGWEIVPLRRLGSCVNGISKGGEFFGSGYPFVSYSDVYKNDWLPASVKGLVESTPEERKHYSVREGDVFFTRTSETVDELGMAGACLKTIPDAVFAGFLIRFRPDTTELAVEYSKYYFRNVGLRNFFTKETMLVTRASLSQDLLRSMMVVVPPRSEQIAIARFLDKKCAAIDRVISEKESLISDLESYKKSLIFECVTGKMEVA